MTSRRLSHRRPAFVIKNDAVVIINFYRCLVTLAVFKDFHPTIQVVILGPRNRGGNGPFSVAKAEAWMGREKSRELREKSFQPRDQGVP